MGFKAEDKTIGDLLVNAVYAIPRNQRKYVWKEDNWKDISSDIHYAINNKTNHFVGSIVLKVEKKEDGLSRYTIIDGQQRIMTITIMLLSIMYTLKKYGSKENADGIEKNIKARNNRAESISIIDSNAISSLSRLIDKICYLTCEEAKVTSVNMVSNQCIVDYTKDSAILECFKYFVNVFENMENNQLLLYLEKSLEMVYIHIEAKNDEDSYTIFETLNARGEALEDHELLKNFIMRYIQPRKDVDAAKEVWKTMEMRLGDKFGLFIKHYTSHSFKTDDNSRKEPYKHIKNNIDINDVNKLLSDLEMKTKYYDRIINPSKKIDIPSGEVYYFSFFKSKRQEQFRPLLLSLMQQLDNENISEEIYLKVLNYLYVFFVCYIVIGKEKSNKIHDLVNKYAFSIASYDGKKVEEIIKSLITDLNKKLPSRELFLSNFSNVGYSNHVNFYKEKSEKNRVKTVLQLIEQYYSNNYDFLEFTIEHMHPDNEGGDNVKIGNLIPLENEINEKLKSKPLKDKVVFYRNSNFCFARKSWDSYDKYNGININIRSKILGELVFDKILMMERM